MFKLYKPNSKNSGHLFALKYDSNLFSPFSENNSDVDNFYITMVKQSSYDASSKRGAFKQDMKDPAKVINLKFSEFEAGSIINSIERKVPLELFHRSESGSSKISLTFSQESGNYLFSALRNGVSFSIPISSGESVCLRESLKHNLTLIYERRAKQERANQKVYTNGNDRQAEHQR